MEAELHAAFVWDCDDCGTENFERAIEGELDEAALMADENRIAGDLVAIEAENDADDHWMADALVMRISVLPKYVKCRACGRTFTAKVWTLDDDDDVSD